MASCGSKLWQTSPIAQKTKVIYFLLLPQSSWIWSLWWRTERPPWTFDHRPFDHKYSQRCDSLWGNFHRITAGVQTVNHGSFWITSSPGYQCPHRTGHLQPFSSWKGNKLGENTNHSKFRNCQNWHKNYFDVKTCTYLRDFFRLEKRFLGARGDAGIPPPPPFIKHYDHQDHDQHLYHHHWGEAQLHILWSSVTFLIVRCHLMVDQASAVPGHAGERLVRELRRLPQIPGLF